MRLALTIASPFALMLRAARGVFRERVYAGVAFLSALLFFGMYLLVPVFLVPGNSLSLEFSLISTLDYALLCALACSTGVLLSFEVFAFVRSRAEGIRAAGESGVGLLASLTGGILAAASCGCGVGILLGLAGLGGGAFFVINHQTLIIVCMLAVVLVGLFFSARRAAGICATCRA